VHVRNWRSLAARCRIIEAFFIAARIDRHQNRWDSAVANLQKANDLDPRNIEVAFWLGDTYSYMRRYHDHEQLLKKCAARDVIAGPWNQMLLAGIKLAQGDPAAAQSLLEQTPPDFSPSEEIWQTRFLAALYLRDYYAAIRVIAATPAKWADQALGGQPSESRADGEVARCPALVKWHLGLPDRLPSPGPLTPARQCIFQFVNSKAGS